MTEFNRNYIIEAVKQIKIQKGLIKVQNNKIKEKSSQAFDLNKI